MKIKIDHVEWRKGTAYYRRRIPSDLQNTDLYEIEGMDRSEVKAIINTIVGKGYVASVGDKEAKVLERFPLLNELETRGIDSTHLQAIDSEILCNALLALKRDHRIPALPVHDCLIVRQKDVRVAQEVFSRAFYNLVGVKPAMTVGYP